MTQEKQTHKMDAAVKARLDAEAKRLKLVCDSVQHLPAFRADVKTGIFASQLVRATLAELFRFEFQETKYANGELINIVSNVNEGAKEFSYLELEHTGRADIVADNATDLPAADVDGRNNIRPIKTLATYVRYSTQDIRTARMQGMFDIATEKAQAAREAMDLKVDNLIRTGDGPTGLQGLTNHSGIIVTNAVNGSWGAATSADIVEDFTTAANTIMNQSDAVEVPDTAVFPVAQWTRISTLPFNSAGGDRTTLEYLQRAFPWITRWTWEAGLSTVSASNGPSVMIYRRDPRKVRAVMPMMMRAMPAEQRGLNIHLTFESRFGGVIAPRPRSILRLDGV